MGEWDCLVDNDLNWSSESQIADKKTTIKKVSMYMWFCSGPEIKKGQIAVSKHFEILPKIREGSNTAMVCVKIASSATIIVCLVYSVTWFGGSVKYGSLLDQLVDLVLQVVLFYLPHRQTCSALN